MLVLNTLEDLVTIDTSTVLATIVFHSLIPKNYTDQILFMSTDMHNLLAYASTQEDIINQSNKSMYIQSVETYMKKLSNPPKEHDPTIVNSMISTCASNYDMPSDTELSLFVNRITPNGKLRKKVKATTNPVDITIDTVDMTEAQKSFLNKCLLQQMHWSHLQAISDKFLATSQSEDETYRQIIEDILAGHKVKTYKMHKDLLFKITNKHPAGLEILRLCLIY